MTGLKLYLMLGEDGNQSKMLFQQIIRHITYISPRKNTIPVADPGFPMGDVDPLGGGGAWTPNVGTFWQKCMQK